MAPAASESWQGRPLQPIELGFADYAVALAAGWSMLTLADNAS